MKGLSDTAWAVVAIICILLVPVLSYLWATLNSNIFAVAIFVAGGFFVYAVNRCAR